LFSDIYYFFRFSFAGILFLYYIGNK